jgi:hypothetical protein
MQFTRNRRGIRGRESTAHLGLTARHANSGKTLDAGRGRGCARSPRRACELTSSASGLSAGEDGGELDFVACNGRANDMDREDDGGLSGRIGLATALLDGEAMAVLWRCVVTQHTTVCIVCKSLT